MDALAIAEATAREAGALLMTYYGRPLTIESKAARNDLVTSADRASEALIVRRLLAATPEAAVLAEETGLHAGSAAQRWIVDPLDGTTNFAHAYPPFCVSIAFEEEGELVAAVVFAPKFDECFTAQSGGGARLNGEPIRVSAIAHIEDALVCTGFSPRVPDRNFTEFALMTRHAQAVRRDGSAALNLAYLAAGRFDVSGSTTSNRGTLRRGRSSYAKPAAPSPTSTDRPCAWTVLKLWQRTGPCTPRSPRCSARRRRGLE